MIVKTREDVFGTKGEAHGDQWRSLRLLLEPGFDMILWQKNHLEACYCIEGEGTVEELDSGRIHEIKAGTLYAMNNHDRHRIRAVTRMRVICTFVPPLTGEEVHDADGSL